MPSTKTEPDRETTASAPGNYHRWPGLGVVVGWWLVLTIVTAVPLGVGLLSQTPDNRFVGLADKVPDAASYLARMRLGYDGAWLYRNPYTAEPHPATLTNVFFLVLGHLCRWLHLSLIVGFHLFRVVFGGLMLLSVAWLAGVCLPSRRAARAAVGVFAVASGFGFWAALFSPQVQPNASLDLWVPEALGFYSFMVNPVFCLSVALTVWILGLVHTTSEHSGTWRLILIGLLSALLCVVHPYDGLTVCTISVLVCGLLWVTRKLPPTPAAAVVAGAVPVLGYYRWAYSQGPGLEGALALNQTPTPAVWWVFSGFGVLWMLAGAGWVMAKRNNWRLPLLVPVWIIAQFALLYAPIQFQRKLIQGMEVPLALLAAIAWSRLPAWVWTGGPRRQRVLRRLMANGLAVLLCITNGFVVVRQCLRIGSGHRLFYLTNDELRALTWLRTHTRPEETVLASDHLGLFTPVLAGNRVVVGHWAETPHFDQRQQEVARFFARSASPAYRATLLTRFQVRYVLVGREEGPDGKFVAEHSSFLRPVFAASRAVVYVVDQGRLPDGLPSAATNGPAAGKQPGPGIVRPAIPSPLKPTDSRKENAK